MKRQNTGRDIQRKDFVETLYKSLKKQAIQAVASQQKWIKLASEYLQDGMERDECVELLVIDGLSREAANGYVNMANDNGGDGSEYTFQFEDTGGRIWSSVELGKVVTASSDADAWRKAEEILFSEVNLSDCEPERIISVNQVQ